GWVARSGQSALVPDAHAHPHFYGEVAPGFTTRDIVCVPLVARDEVIGVIELLNKRQGTFTEDDVRVLESVATQAATAIENARLFEETRQRMAELEALQRTSLQLTSSLDLSIVLDSIVESALTLVGATDCHIYLYDEAGETFTFGAALWEDGRREAAMKVPRREGLTATVAREGHPIVINDAAHHPLYTTPEARKWGLQAIAGFPLKRAGQVLGAFTIAFLEPHTFGEEELRVLGLLADQAAIAIEKAWLYEKERQARRVAEALRDATATLAGSLELDQVLDRILDEVQRVIPHDAANISLVEGDTLRFVRWRGYERFGVDTQVPGLGFRIADTPNYQYMAETGQPKVVSDTAVDPEWIQVPGWEWLRSYVGAPFQVREKLTGFLSLDSATPGFFNADHARLLATFAHQIAVAVENARLFGDVEQARAEWEATFQAIGDGISIHDRDFRLVRVNRALAERLGATPEALVGRLCYELFHHTTAPPDWCPHLKATKTGQPQTVEIEEPVLGGTFLISAYPLFDERGQVSGSVHVLKDITERKQLEAQLRQAQKMEAIGQLAGGIAHDFNNLLTPIGGFAELLLWKAPEGSQQYEYLRQIKVAVERAAALTRQLRLFTRHEEGERRPLQLNSLVEETRALLERSIPKEITIELHLESELWAVEADLSQISQVLMNL
ncbi:MAG TPA: GAF domain-containing protein, partial [Anaerolineae bacterium]|nr:GAF domain-containing protein [Anaerolineae bacterium]